MNPDEQKSFLDGRTLIAIALMIAVWFGWENYLKKKYPQPQKPATEAAQTIQTPTLSGPSSPTNVAPGTPSSAGAPNVAKNSASKESLSAFNSPEISFEISSRGMGLKNIILNKYVDRAGHPVRLGATDGILPLETVLAGQTEPIQFDVTKVSDLEFQGVAKLEGGSIKKVLKIEPQNYVIVVTTELDGGATGLTEFLSEESHPSPESTGKALGDDPKHWLSFFALTEGKKERESLDNTVASSKVFSKISAAALGSRYFTMAVADNSGSIPNFETVSAPDKNLIYGGLNYRVLPGSSQLKVENKFLFGPKSVDILRSADPKLEGVVDFGMFSLIAYPILDLLKWLHKILNNYGFAIIVLTILVRFIVLPFNVMSYRSMKAMQVIQPHINRLKERYKDDREALNREMMILMRDNKVNPLGGCLPMLLQLPVFLALYQVLNQTVELYHSPFIFWIQDLSLKDPFYVTPVLMGITMFIQQKMTPTTMDPAQAKVMQFMPIMFTFMMVSLPSGLTLYIFVSTLFGIIQQMAFMRDKKTVANGNAAAVAGR